MVKHNNVIPNGHYHKDWQRQVKTFLSQPMKKKMRRVRRAAKAAAMAPRPAAGLLRPVVRCQTLKYQSRQRTGRGFTLAELKEAGINRREARQIGIAVDHRRDNQSVEAMQANVQRLKDFKAKLVVFPRKNNTRPKAGDAPAAETANATQLMDTVIMPVANAAHEVERMAITDEMKAGKAYQTLRVARNEQKLTGRRWAAKNKKD